MYVLVRAVHGVTDPARMPGLTVTERVRMTPVPVDSNGAMLAESREIAVRWNHDAVNKKVAFVHVECEGERYTVEIAYRPGFGRRRWKLGHQHRWMVTDGD